MSQEMEIQGFELSAEELEAVAGGAADISNSKIKNERVKVGGTLTATNDKFYNDHVKVGHYGQLNASYDTFSGGSLTIL